MRTSSVEVASEFEDGVGVFDAVGRACAVGVAGAVVRVAMGAGVSVGDGVGKKLHEVAINRVSAKECLKVLRFKKISPLKLFDPVDRMFI